MEIKDRLDELEAQLDHMTNRIDHLRDEFVDHIEKENNLKKPLIKDEKIRKAVRAFAEANGLDKVYYSADFVRFSVDPDVSFSFDFYK